MSKITDLFNKACAIRDAQVEGENTPQRIGTLFTGIIEAVDAMLPAAVPDARSITVKTHTSGAELQLGYKDAIGNSNKITVDIPVAGNGKAGLMLPVDRETIYDNENQIGVLGGAVDGLLSADVAMQRRIGALEDNASGMLDDISGNREDIAALGEAVRAIPSKQDIVSSTQGVAVTAGRYVIRDETREHAGVNCTDFFRPDAGMRVSKGMCNAGLYMIYGYDVNRKYVCGFAIGEGTDIAAADYEFTRRDMERMVAEGAVWVRVNLARDGYVSMPRTCCADPELSVLGAFPLVEGNRLEIFKHSVTNELPGQTLCDLAVRKIQLMTTIDPFASGETPSSIPSGRFRENAFYVDSNGATGTAHYTFALYDARHRLVCEQSATVEHIGRKSAPKRNLNVLCVGDSFTHINTWVAELRRRLTGTGGTPEADGLGNITFIGTRTADQAPCEGYPATAWDFFTGSGSPFWKGGKLDVARYALENGYQSIDAVLILLGANGAAKDDVMATLLDAFRAYNPAVKFLIGSNRMKYNPYGWPEGDTDLLRAGMMSSMWNPDWMSWNRQLHDFAESQANAWFVNVPPQLDLVNNWGCRTVPANSRNSAVTVREGTDNIHPSEPGMLQIADAFYNAFHAYVL